MAAACLLPGVTAQNTVYADDPQPTAEELASQNNNDGTNPYDTSDPANPAGAGSPVDPVDPNDPPQQNDQAQPTATTAPPASTARPTIAPKQLTTSPTTTQPTTTRATTAPAPIGVNPALKSVVAGYKCITVTWTPARNAAGYQVYYKKSKGKKKIVTVGAVTKKTLTNLKSGKKYKIKVRSFQKKNGKKVYSKWTKTKSATVCYTDWAMLQKKYQGNSNVRQLIFVQYKSGSNATLILYDKTSSGVWKQILSCTAYVGSKGINKKKEGDRKTPVGQFDLTCAFGINSDPGSKMPYTKVHKNLYWCADKYYNTMVDVSKKPHKCSGEHLINYTKQYAYAMNIGYNKSGTKGKGSAIFLHCFGNHKYTLGCVAVSQANMIKILRTCGYGSKICIYRR